MKKLDLFKSLSVLASTFILGGTVFAQNPSDIDTGFGSEGFSFTNHLENADEFLYKTITLSNDKILSVGFSVSGSQDVLLVKYNVDGTQDITFGNLGVLSIDLSIGGDEQGYSVAELEDGKLLVVGVVEGMSSNDAFILKLEANGDFDATFANGAGYTRLNAGSETASIAYDLHVNDDNSILVAGSVMNDLDDPDFVVYKITEDGELNESFSSSGSTLIDNEAGTDLLTSMDVDANGNIYLAGTSEVNGEVNGFLVKLNSYGIIDNSFNTTGKVIYHSGADGHAFNDVKIVSGNKVMITGYEGTGDNIDGIILRYNTNGSADETFSSDGKQVSDIGASNGVYLFQLEEYEDGRIIVTGNVNGASMKGIYAMMLLENGDPDFDFAAGGDVIHDFPISISNLELRCMALQSNGKIVIAGNVTGQDFTDVNMMMTRLHIEAVVGLDELSNSELKIFPNPMNDVFQIATDANVHQLNMVDLNGKLVQTWNGDASSFVVDSSVPMGNYLIVVTTDKGNSVQKVVKK